MVGSLVGLAATESLTSIDEKFDVVMCVKNGAATLPVVLRRIDEVIPKGRINQKIMINDHSSDSSPEIGRRFGWTIYQSEGSGISSALNTALGKVATEVFILFEQDLRLSKSWFKNVFPLIFADDVVLASGVRFVTAPELYRQIELLGYNQTLKRLKRHELVGRLIGRTFDNTVVKTAFMKSVGEFPRLKTVCQDYTTSLLVEQSGYKWAVDFMTISEHIKPNSYRFALKKELWYARSVKEAFRLMHQPIPFQESRRGRVWRLIKSPMTSMKLLRQIKNPLIVPYYLLMCICQLIGFMRKE